MKKVPELKNEKLEDAKEILDKAGIFYEEDEEKEFSLRVRRGRITRTEPKENEEIKDGEKVTLYVSKLWLLPFILLFILFFLVLLVGGIGVSQLINNNKPIIESTYEGWVPRNTVYVKKDVNVSKIDTYLYCVTKSKSSKKCDWKETKTKNTYLSESGKWNVFFKARYKDGKFSYVSNRKEVLIDNNAPIIDSITKNVSSNSLSFNINAVDHESGIKTISYKIGNKDYVSVNNKFTISKLEPDTEYTITVRIEDNAGNVYEVTYKEKTNNKDDNTTTPDHNGENSNTTSNTNNTTNNSSSNNTTNNNGTTNSVDNTTNSSGNTTNPSDLTKPTNPSDTTNPTDPTEKPTEKPTDSTTNPTDKTTEKTKPTESTNTTEKTKPTESTKTTEKTKTTESTKTTEKTTEKTKPVEPVVEIPKIDLNDLPAEFGYGEDYKLPSHVEFGESGGTYSCALDHDWSKNVESTKDFAVGHYTVSCKAVSNTGAYAEVSKDIKVTVPTGEDEEWDGWIRLNLYYPAESTNREWRLHREGEIRGEDDDWESYTGPILVKVSDIENIYIRYDIDGEKHIDVPSSKVLVDIQADKKSLKGNETTKVKIVFDTNAKTKEYRINGGDWTEYTKEFSVGADTLIEARATREENVYDDEGNFVMMKTLAGNDAFYVSEIMDEPLDFGTVNIKIKADKNPLPDSESTNVEIEYEDNSTSRMYKIDNGPWLEYTGIFRVSANQTVYAYAEKEVNKKLDDGTSRIGIAKGKVKKLILSESNPIEESNLSVDIKASSYKLLKNQLADITITSNEANSKIYYSLDNCNYTEYTSSFKVGTNTTIYAYAEHEGKYAYDRIYVGAVTIPDILEGPTISINPTSITESTTVTITTKEEAKNIYYSIDGGIYQLYTEPFEVNKNGIVRAYYIRSDNKKSETTYYYVQNIKEKNKPYVRIDANPSIYLSEDVDRVIVTISGSNYDTLEYSYNGIEYSPYISPLEITRSRSVYAKGTNEYGSTIEKLNITTSIAPTPIEHLDVAITLDPEEKDVTGLIDKLEVTINYDDRTEGKYYRLGSGELLPYTGPFEVNENTTVYAYATSEGGLGSTSKQINYLTTGIASPIIHVNPTTPNSWVRVEIEYAKTASVKKYKIDNGDWLDYTMPIEIISNNTRIYAYNEDTLGHHEEAEVLIDNIIPKENISVLDNGMYYLIRLNYPDSSLKEHREYKWKKSGTWKKYDEHGILLIRPEYKDKVIDADGVKIKDSNGNVITMKDHYYVLDVPLSELSENLFMRWDLTKPQTPTFIVSTDDWTKEVTVGINYDKTSAQKLYKIVYEDGTDTGWLEYEKPVVIDKENSIIYAKAINEVDVESTIANKKIINIDRTAPEIVVNGDFTTPKQKVTFQVKVNDNGKVDKILYAKGEQEESYFNENGKAITNNGTTTVDENGKYTIYVVDTAGNVSIKVIEITNIDKDAPNVVISVLTAKYGDEAEVSIDYGDSSIKQYSIGNNQAYKNYAGNIKIKANDVLNLANEDGTLTVYAKGRDTAGNEVIVSELIYVLDLDAPATPIINASAGYPILTEYGVKLDDELSVVYDKRDDIDNYISLDGGNTWKIYDGTEHISSGTIMAKSVKKESGLTMSASTTLKMPGDAIGVNAYDGDSTTRTGDLKKQSYMLIDASMHGKKTYLYGRITKGYSIELADGTKKSYSSFGSNLSPSSSTVIIPENAVRFIFPAYTVQQQASDLYEIYPIEAPALIENKFYPLITEYGVQAAYNEVKIEYFSTSVEKYYRINESEWKDYEGQTIRLEINDKLEAKGINKYGKETPITTYNSSLLSNAVGPKAYDGDNSTKNNDFRVESYMHIDSSMFGKKVYLYGRMTKGYSIELSDGTKKSYSSFGGNAYPSSTTVVIPENAIRFIFPAYTVQQQASDLYEIYPLEPHIITVMDKNYPLITEYGIQAGYNEVKIEYFSTSVKKYYRINGGEWKEYEDKLIKVNMGEIIEAKGINKYGKETQISSYKSETYDALEPVAYDNNETTSFALKGKGPILRYLNVSPDMYGKNITIVRKLGLFADMGIQCFDENGNIISSQLNGGGNGQRQTNNYVIVDNTKKIAVYYSSSQSGDWGSILELEVANAKTMANIADLKISDIILPSPIILFDSYDESSSKIVTIKYSPGFTNEYSLDNGESWTPYTNPITVSENLTVIARVRSNDKVLSASSFTITKIKENEEAIEIPNEFNEGDDYTIPDTCTIDNIRYNNINELSEGEYNLVCELTSDDKSLVNKPITIRKKLEE